MSKRPHSVTVISLLFIAAGAVGLAYHATEFKAQAHFQSELVWVCFVRVLAILAGAFMLLGRNWARWLSIGWIAYHVVLSVFHTWSELAMHALLFVVITFFLLRPQASTYFRGVRDK